VFNNKPSPTPVAIKALARSSVVFFIGITFRFCRFVPGSSALSETL
jgi:hypothetical protein